MDAIPSNLCTLVEQLEDARQFHDGAARQSDGPYRERHSARSLAYALMLSEIRQWESRKRRPAAGERSTFAGFDPDPPSHDDSYAALLERVYRIHSEIGPVAPTIHARAAALDGRRAGSSMGMGAAMRC